MKPSFEKLVPPVGESFRCFDRSVLPSPVKWHRHPEIELTFVQEGSGSRLVGDHIGSYRDSELVLLGSDLPHTWSSDEYRGEKYDRHRAIVIQFHPEFLGDQFWATPELKAVSKLVRRARRGIWYPADMGREIGQRMTNMVAMSGLPRLMELLACLDELASTKRGRLLSSESYSFTANEEGETRIKTVCDHISRHFTDPELNLQTLADLVYMNTSSFSRFFRQSTGRSITDYMSELRIGLACRLLTETDESILKISHEAGFENLSNFNRRFRKLRETTPREYRQRHQANQ